MKDFLRIAWAVAIVFAFGLILGHYTSTNAVVVVACVLFSGSAAFYGASAFYAWWQRQLDKADCELERDRIQAEARARRTWQ